MRKFIIVVILVLAFLAGALVACFQMLYGENLKADLPVYEKGDFPSAKTHYLMYLDCDSTSFDKDVDIWCKAPECHFLTVKKEGIERHYEASELCGGLK